MLLTADRVIHNGLAYSDVGISVDATGRIDTIAPLRDLGRPDRNLTGKVLMAGAVNAHSHAFHRLLRGRSQVAGPHNDNFWTWREAMYWVAQHLEPQDLYVVARQAFIEMLLAGVTCVGEFHYLHHQPDGKPYDNAFAMADALVYAAREAGIRLSLIDTLYLRGDFATPAEGAQKRFCAPSLDAFCDRFDALVERIMSYKDTRLSWAVAAHSLRTVPIEALIGLKVRLSHMPLHIHVAEQQQEVDACIAAHGQSPVELLVRTEVCDACTTLVHATHLRGREAEAIAGTGSLVCICPTTEADLGDGLASVSTLHGLGVPLCLGTDGQVQASVWAEARQLEMHERLRTQKRNTLARSRGDAPATHLLRAATTTGAVALGVDAGELASGKWADFITFDLANPALAGADDHTLLSHILFSADTRAICDVMVSGSWVVEDGKHPLARDSATAYSRLAQRIFTGAPAPLGADSN